MPGLSALWRMSPRYGSSSRPDSAPIAEKPNRGPCFRRGPSDLSTLESVVKAEAAPLSAALGLEAVGGSVASNPPPVNLLRIRLLSAALSAFETAIGVQ